jgi:hypothetical protein
MCKLLSTNFFISSELSHFFYQETEIARMIPLGKWEKSLLKRKVKDYNFNDA